MSSLVLPCPGGMPLPGPLFGIACAIIFWVLVVEFDISRKQTKRKPSLFFIRQKNQKSRKQCKSYLWEVVRNMVVEYQRQGPSNSTLMNKIVCKTHLFFIIFTPSLSTSPISSSVRRIGGRTGSGLGSWRPDWAKKSQKSSFGREKCLMSPIPIIPNVRPEFLVEKPQRDEVNYFWICFPGSAVHCSLKVSTHSPKWDTLLTIFTNFLWRSDSFYQGCKAFLLKT